MWVNHLCLISEFRNVEVSDKIFPDVLSTSRKSCHRQLHSCYSCKGRWCKALFIITIMWVNHLCLISEFRNVEEYIKKTLVTDKFTVVIHGEDDDANLCSIQLAKKFYKLLKNR